MCYNQIIWLRSFVNKPSTKLKIGAMELALTIDNKYMYLIDVTQWTNKMSPVPLSSVFAVGIKTFRLDTLVLWVLSLSGLTWWCKAAPALFKDDLTGFPKLVTLDLAVPSE